MKKKEDKQNKNKTSLTGHIMKKNELEQSNKSQELLKGETKRTPEMKYKGITAYIPIIRPLQADLCPTVDKVFKNTSG